MAGKKRWAPPPAQASVPQPYTGRNRWIASITGGRILRRSSLSMEESRTITRKSASNLALAFVLLPRAKRDGMSTLYAFCREVDDVADDESSPVERRREQ